MAVAAQAPGRRAAGVESLFYWYVSACVLISLVVYWTMRETSSSSELEKDVLSEGVAGRG